MIGKSIGKYRIVGQLGRGGMGTVYKAVDETLDRKVAIKMLNPELVETEVMKRFRAEATILARLNHPDIATIYELFQSETHLVMVMEFVRGDTLERISDRCGALPPDQAAYLVGRILSALEHAHRAGVVHRDMKPANVMVTDQGGVKIMDFGIARVRGAEHVTLDGYMMGTPAYMPPEQVLAQAVDGRADLYAVGVVLYRLLTGRLPFEATTTVAMIMQQMSESPTPLHAHRDDLPPWCDAVLQRALAKSADDRFQTAEEFREVLDKAAGPLTTELARAFMLTPAPVTTPTPSSAFERFAITPMPAALPHTERLAPGSAPLADGFAPSGGALSALRAVGRTVRQLEALNEAVVGRAMLALIVAALLVVAIVAMRRTPGGVDARPAAVGQAPALEPSAGQREEAPVPRPSPGPKAPPSAPADDPASRLAPGAAAAGNESSPPFGFEARALVDDGDRWRERRADVMLADGRISVRSSDDLELLHAVPFEDIITISYSRGRDPLWNAPRGPAVVARPSGIDLGIFRAERYWVSLRTREQPSAFVVLRLANAAQARRVIEALEERTGQRSAVVVERKASR